MERRFRAGLQLGWEVGEDGRDVMGREWVGRVREEGSKQVLYLQALPLSACPAAPGEPAALNLDMAEVWLCEACEACEACEVCVGACRCAAV